MNLKKVLILSIAGLVLWSAWGSEVHADESIKGDLLINEGFSGGSCLSKI